MQEAAVQLNTVNIQQGLTLVQNDSLPVHLCMREGPANNALFQAVTGRHPGTPSILAVHRCHSRHIKSVQ